MSAAQSTGSTVTVTLDQGVGLIEFNRPKEMNSFIPRQYTDVVQALKQLDEDEACVVAVITGQGPFYSSGHDLRGFDRFLNEPDPVKSIQDSTDSQARELVRAFIDFSKPILCCVNGGCIGIACTSAQLCDVVYAAESAFFEVPFMKHGFCAEGCSSVTFPAVLGTSKANEMLLLGLRLSSAEAHRTGFVADVFPDASLRAEVMARARKMAAFPPNALKVTKGLVRTAAVKAQLHAVNVAELEELKQRFVSSEVLTAMMAFAAGQKKKKAGKGDAPRAKL